MKLIQLPKDVVWDNHKRLFEMIANGEDMEDVAKSVGLKATDLIREFRANETLIEEWEIAREARGERFVTPIMNTIEDVLAERVTPAAAKVAIEGYKYLGEKYAPRLLGKETNLTKKREGSNQGVFITIVPSSSVKPENDVIDITHAEPASKRGRPKKLS